MATKIDMWRFFENGQCEITHYIYALEEHFLDECIESDKEKMELLMCSLPANILEILRSGCCQSKSVETLKYTEAKQLLMAEYEPKEPLIVHRCRFLERKQLIGESCMNYSLALKNLAEKCEFGEYFEERLLPTFLVGLSSMYIRVDLLIQPDLKWSDAVARAINLESSLKISGHKFIED